MYINIPKVSGNTSEVEQINSALYQLTNQLNAALADIEAKLNGGYSGSTNGTEKLTFDNGILKSKE